MRKLLLFGCIVMGMCLFAGCNSGTEERMKTGEEIANEQYQKAQDLINENNSSVQDLEDQSDIIDEEY